MTRNGGQHRVGCLLALGAEKGFGVPVPRQRLIHVQGSATGIGKIYQPEPGIQAGPNAFAAAACARALASGTGAVLDLDISPEALTPCQTLSQMRAAALARKAAP